MSNEGQWCDPGYCQLAEVSNHAKELKEKLAECEARLGKAVKALNNAAIQLDWCQTAREISREIDATLAEIKGESQ